VLTITVDDIWAYLDGDARAFGPVDAVTSYLSPGRFFAPSFKRGTWDGRIKLREFDRKQKQYRIPSGALELVCEALDAAAIQYVIDDLRQIEVPELVTDLADGTKLRPYQIEKMCLPALFKGRGVIKAIVGAGKTRVAAALIASYNLPTLWLTDKLVLMHQTHKVLTQALGKPVGLLGGGIEQINPDITVAMVQTLVSRKDALQNYLKTLKVLILDEAHHAAADTWFQTIQAIPAPYRYGITATPVFGGDGLRLLGATGSVTCEVQAQELIESGFLMAPEIYFQTTITPELPKGTDYRAAYKAGVTQNEDRNAQICDLAWTFYVENLISMTLTKEVGHGKLLAAMYEKMGLKAEFIHGAITQEEREELLGRLIDRKLDHLVAQAQIMGEGVDIPQLEGLINATGTRGGGSSRTKSEFDTGRNTIQAIGRLLRTHPKKTKAVYVDKLDPHHKTLLAASKDRVQALKDEGFAKYLKRWEDRPIA